MAEIEFCNSDCVLSDEIPKLLTEFILMDIKTETIQTRYKNMISNFDSLNPTWEVIDGFETVEYGDLEIPIANLRFQNLTQATNLGLDLPTWFNYEKNKATVMILAMEPLRKPKQPFSSYATLASPFALHHKSARNKLPYSTTYKFINELIDHNYNVYLTDIYKLYCLLNNQKYTGEKVLNHEIFTKELSIVKPEYIVVFGKTANDRFNEFIKFFGKFNIKVIPLAHPAGFGGNKHFLSEFNRIKDY